MKHYRQATSYTCDPACLMMAMHAMDKRQKMTRKLEMRIWNEANLVSVPGCLPQGLALSAAKRGFGAEIICRRQYMHETTKDDRISVSIAKRQEKECRKKCIRLRDKTPTIKDIEKALLCGSVPLVLVNAKKLHEINSPHWIVVSKVTGKRVYFHDPLLDKEASLTKEEFKSLHNQIRSFLNKKALIISKQKR